MAEEGKQNKITTLIFDVDDTLYDVYTGFTQHRNGEGAAAFMVAKLGFPDIASAKALRDEYFERYHSTAKALTVAEQEGRFPTVPGSDSDSSTDTRFHARDLAEYWSEHLNFDLLGGPYEDLCKMFESCPEKLKLVAFSNGPRKYVLRVLKEIGLDKIFPDEMVFAVDDVLPYCKPEREAFELIFDKISDGKNRIKPEECVMVEDSMKNVRVAKELGMKTVLITGSSSARKQKSDNRVLDAEATKQSDLPNSRDSAVDLSLETCIELKDAMPSLWDQNQPFWK